MKLRTWILGLMSAGLVACSQAPSVSSTSAAATAPPPAPAAPVGQVMPQKPVDAITLPDGLAYKVLKPGTGTEHPALTDQVTANYSLWKPDGTMLESTCTPQGQCTPATFPLGKLIPGWQEAIPLMTTGETIDLWLTADLAYGDPPRKPDRPAGPLIFEIQLLGIQH